MDTLSKKALRTYSGNKWQAHKNSSWGEQHIKKFGNRSGYVICYNNKHRELVALASVIGQPFVTQAEIDANAKLIAKCPELLELALFIASHEKGSAPSVGYFESIIDKAQTILKDLEK